MSGAANYRSLMHEVCVVRGWCGGFINGKPTHVDDLIPSDGTVSATQFVDLLFLADGMDPNAEPEKWQSHKDELRAAFIRHMGADEVEASRLTRDSE